MNKNTNQRTLPTSNLIQCITEKWLSLFKLWLN
nr:MAG TPA: hypothetical protein [Caudoviricetes sp.]